MRTTTATTMQTTTIKPTTTSLPTTTIKPTTSHSVDNCGVVDGKTLSDSTYGASMTLSKRGISDDSYAEETPEYVPTKDCPAHGAPYTPTPSGECPTTVTSVVQKTVVEQPPESTIYMVSTAICTRTISEYIPVTSTTWTHDLAHVTSTLELTQTITWTHPTTTVTAACTPTPVAEKCGSEMEKPASKFLVPSVRVFTVTILICDPRWHPWMHLQILLQQRREAAPELNHQGPDCIPGAHWSVEGRMSRLL